MSFLKIALICLSEKYKRGRLPSIDFLKTPVSYASIVFFKLISFSSTYRKIITVKVLLFMGDQFSWFSWLQQTMKFSVQRQVKFPMSCKAKTGKP